MIWLIPATPDDYEIEKIFEDNNIIDWGVRQKDSFQIGDIVFLYFSYPIGAIKYKCTVVGESPISIDDSLFWKNPDKKRNNEHKDKIYLEKLGESSNDGLKFSELKKNGLKSKVQGPEKIHEKVELVEYIDSFFQNGQHSPIYNGLIDNSLPKDNEHKEENINTKDEEKTIALPFNRILFGPPGTGKTYQTIRQAVEYLDDDFGGDYKERFKSLKTDGRVIFTTFHQSFAYEDFVEGLKAKTNENDHIQYKVEEGIFKQICEKASENPHQPYLLIIDEINRGNISRIFGELITRRIQQRSAENLGNPIK